MNRLSAWSMAGVVGAVALTIGSASASHLTVEIDPFPTKVTIDAPIPEEQTTAASKLSMASTP
jgi:hypothetical protein